MTRNTQINRRPGAETRRPRTASLRLVALLAAAFGLSGCVIATPYKTLDSPALTQSPTEPRTAIVVLTEAVVRDDAASREAFQDGTRRVMASLAGQPGLLGYSVRRELFGAKAWTMTAWRDEASLALFLNSAPHSAVAPIAGETLTDSAFARVEVDRGRLPLSWDEALGILETRRRGYSAVE